MNSSNSQSLSLACSSSLHELSDSEKNYGSDLLVIIKRIAAAYSPQNLPPPHLDHHFRLMETIFRFTKTFTNALITLVSSPDPLDPSQIAHFLSSWILQLETAYGRYCGPRGWAGAGGWSRDRSVMGNPQLRQILASLPWPASLPHPPTDLFPGAPYPTEDVLSTDNQGVPHATLTAFFALPFSRLVYYRRFYEKHLKRYSPGSPDHRLLYDASTRLSNLLDAGCRQWNVQPIPSSDSHQRPPPPPSLTHTSHPTIANRPPPSPLESNPAHPSQTQQPPLRSNRQPTNMRPTDMRTSTETATSLSGAATASIASARE